MKRAPAVALLAFLAVPSQGTQVGLVLKDAWIRTAPPGASAHVAYFTLENPSDAAWRVVAVEAEGFGAAELHETVVTDGQSRMRRVTELALPPRGRVVAAPGGLHAMLFRPARAPRAGGRLALTLIFAGGERLTTQADVRDARAAPGPSP